jgi:hypothetical protein
VSQCQAERPIPGGVEYCQREALHQGAHAFQSGDSLSTKLAQAHAAGFRAGVEAAMEVVSLYDEGGSFRHLMHDLRGLLAPPTKGDKP